MGGALLPKWAWAGLAFVLMAAAAVVGLMVTRPAIPELPGRVLPDSEWVGLGTLRMGETMTYRRDVGDWDVSARSVTWNVADPPRELPQPPARAVYMAVDIEARDWSTVDSTAWVSFHFDFVTETGRLYPEATCYEDGCLATAPMDYRGTYEGRLYFLVPEGTDTGYLMIDPLVTNDENILVTL